MSRIVQRTFGAEISAGDRERAFNAVSMLPPEDRADIAARRVCVLEQLPASRKEEGHG
jgi:hypothetical protein